MNSLAEATNRLCAEINTLRSYRTTLRRALQEESLVRRATVKKLCSGLRQARLAMSRATREKRHAFLNNLRRVVDKQRHEMSDDLSGARRAWKSKRPSGHYKLDLTGSTPTTSKTHRKDRRRGSPR